MHIIGFPLYPFYLSIYFIPHDFIQTNKNKYLMFMFMVESSVKSVIK